MREADTEDDLSRILPSCGRVSEASELVRINSSRISEFADSLPAALPDVMRHTPHHLIGEPEETVAYFLVLDALNFGSGFFDHFAPYKGEHGYYAVAGALRDWFRQDGVPSPDLLKRMTGARSLEILGQPEFPELSQLATWFARALRELGQFTDEVLQGRYSNLLQLTDRNASKMVSLLCQMPMFRDIASLEDENVYFLKRAQICVQDIAIASEEDGLEQLRITGLERLTVFADNMLPFILEAEGLLVYEESLSRRIQAGHDLGMGSRAEMELRANSIVACDMLRQSLAAKGTATTARVIDFALWNIGDRSAATHAKRLHVCRSYFY